MSGVPPRKKRKHETEAEGDRSPFQRDRDRVLYTEAFRRLSGVSQVAYTGEAELYHDRLSHSLKVAQVGRRIAEYLEDDAPVPVDAEVVETASLAHDIGHPPFGHPAERELDKLIKQKEVSEGFEGNAQSLRVVSHIAVHPETDGRHIPEKEEGQQESNGSTEESEEDAVETGEENEDREDEKASGGDDGDQNNGPDPTLRGLNLTRASLNAMIKYPWKRSAESGDENKWGEDESEKFGRYASERELFDWIRENSEDKRRSPEAEIMDWADDLVYAVHDVEDFYRAGVIPLERILQEGTAEREEFINDYLPEDVEDADKDEFKSEEKVKNMLDRIADLGGISQGFSGTRGDRVKIKDISSQLIERYVGEDSESDLGINLQDPDSDDKRYFQADLQLQKEVGVLKYMLIKYVLDDPAVSAQRRGEKKVIQELFEIFYEATKPDSEEQVEIIHPPFREEAQRLQENGNKRERVRLVADIITIMTEQQAIQIHKRLTGDTPGTFQENIIR